jgi:enoyl-CoA hydratase/carnithine racemase
MEYTSLLVERRGAVAIVTLNRPDRHNALDEALVGELTDCFGHLSVDPLARVVVLAGAGASFCAGADRAWLERIVGFTREENIADARAAQRMFVTIAECPHATIARVHGAVIGGGVGLVAACDIAIASHNAVFGFSEVRLGIIPAVIAPYVVPKIGLGAARALFVSGERLSAEEALRIGLIEQLEPFSLDTAVHRKIESILQAGPQAVAAAKRLLRDIAGRTPQEAADITVERIADIRRSPEGQEGMRSFLEKRPPGFAGDSA